MCMLTGYYIRVNPPIGPPTNESDGRNGGKVQARSGVKRACACFVSNQVKLAGLGRIYGTKSVFNINLYGYLC